MPTFVFQDLDRVTDQIHDAFDAWTADRSFAPVLGRDGVEVLRLAVHEWVANLVQHAHFPDGVRIELDVRAEGDGVRCVLVDTSVGFDLATQIEHQQAILDAPAPSERGRGLLMLVTSTDDLTYAPAGPDGPQRLAFLVRDPGEDFFASLFRPEDLAAEPAFARSIEGAPGGDGLGGSAPPLPAPSAPAGADDR